MNIKEVSLHDRKVCKVCVDKFVRLGVRPWSCLGTSEEADSFRKEITEVINARARAMAMTMAMAIASAHKVRRDVSLSCFHYFPFDVSQHIDLSSMQGLH